MNAHGSISSQKTSTKWVNRRDLIRGAMGAALGTGLLLPSPAHADREDEDNDTGQCPGPRLKPIPGGVIPFKPFGVPVHHNPLNPANPLANISDPSQITDFDGFVGLTHIRGGGTGTDTSTGVTTPLAYQADMGFGQGKFVGVDSRLHRGTFAFV